LKSNSKGLTRRQVFAGFVIVPATLLAAALLLQHFAGHRPCPLCILQRDGFLLAALVALAAAIHNPGRRGALAYLGAMLVPLIAGLGVAIRHIWVLFHPTFGCGIDVLEQIVNGLFVAKWLPGFFYASGGCSDYLDPVLGLNVPQWSLLWYVVLLAAAVFFLFKWFADRAAEAVKSA
jgi:disulfide bond formation protein DsbB